ncbi:hypothetical protein ASPFODRAFT_55376 [Aspergillus luchuensis CBS 106.47]|uniref:Mediator of RNA polymerase II transcription subunit 21 n=2 Tax=Aspergillus subgen. Circumdati TaxID=2720871 RepID=A0A1M3TY28_ASPLC|nr:hypothetical protein ASPFODRAFT_55376 [Aspergillus luchuensis CBS 106.47]
MVELDTKKFRIAKSATELEIESERLEGELEMLKERLADLEAQGLEGDEPTRREREMDDATLLRLKIYRSLGVDIEADDAGNFTKAVIRNSRKGDVHVVNIDPKFSRFFYSNYFCRLTSPQLPPHNLPLLLTQPTHPPIPSIQQRLLKRKQPFHDPQHLLPPLFPNTPQLKPPPLHNLHPLHHRIHPRNILPIPLSASRTPLVASLGLTNIPMTPVPRHPTGADANVPSSSRTILGPSFVLSALHCTSTRGGCSCAGRCQVPTSLALSIHFFTLHHYRHHRLYNSHQLHYSNYTTPTTNQKEIDEGEKTYTMADILTQLQTCLDQLATQFYATLCYLTTYHDNIPATPPPTTTTPSAAPLLAKIPKNASTPPVPASAPQAAQSQSQASPPPPDSTNPPGQGQNADNQQQQNADGTAEGLPAPDSPATFAARQRELARDLVIKEQQIEYLISVLPGIDSSEAEQERRIRELEGELRVVEGVREERRRELGALRRRLEGVLGVVERGIYSRG